MKIRKIAELAFHKNTNEAEAIAAFLALRRSGGLVELTNALGAAKPKEHISSWIISGRDSYIGRAAYIGCMLARQMDGKCHTSMKKKRIFGSQEYTITLKYSTEYSKNSLERNFKRLLNND